MTKLDELIDRVDNPTHLIMNKTMRRRLTAAARSSTIGGFITWDVDAFGRKIAQYADLPILIADKDNTDADILPDFIENGQPITITRAQDGNGEFDPSTGADKPVAPLTFPGYALATSYRQDLVDGTLIQQGDKLFTAAASGLGCTPMASDTLTDVGGDVWSIVSVGIVAPGGVALLYKIQGRK